jgi:hypothetical protein
MDEPGARESIDLQLPALKSGGQCRTLRECAERQEKEGEWKQGAAEVHGGALDSTRLASIGFCVTSP